MTVSLYFCRCGSLEIQSVIRECRRSALIALTFGERGAILARLCPSVRLPARRSSTRIDQASASARSASRTALLWPVRGRVQRGSCAAYLATENYLALFGTHGRALQRALSRQSMPLGLEARNGRAAHSYGQRPGNGSTGFDLNRPSWRGVG